MSSIRKLSRTADGREVWLLRWRDHDGKHKGLRFRTKRDAEAKWAEIRTSLDSGTYIDPTAGKKTVREWWGEYAEIQQWSPSTRERYLTTWKSMIEPELGGRQLAKIRHSELQRVVTRAGTSVNTKKLVRSILHSLFAAAVRDRLIGLNPATDLDVGKDNRDDPRPLADDEIARLLAVCDPWERAWVTMGLQTGVRISEGLAVRLDTIDFDAGTITIGDQARTPDRGAVHLAPTKTRKSRTVPMTAQLAHHMRRHIETTDVAGNDHGVLFAGVRGGLMRRAQATKNFATLIERAGLDAEITWHCLRDTAATTMLRGGVNPAAVARILGNTVPVLLERYAGVVPQDDELAVAALETMQVRHLEAI